MVEVSLRALTHEVNVEEILITFNHLMSPVLHTAKTAANSWHA